MGACCSSSTPEPRVVVRKRSPTAKTALQRANDAEETKTPSERLPVDSEWIIADLIGSGAHGSVYMAMNKFTSAVAAVKVVQGFTIDRMHSEVSMLRKLRHRNIVQYLGGYSENHLLGKGRSAYPRVPFTATRIVPARHFSNQPTRKTHRRRPVGAPVHESKLQSEATETKSQVAKSRVDGRGYDLHLTILQNHLFELHKEPLCRAGAAPPSVKAHRYHYGAVPILGFLFQLRKLRVGAAHSEFDAVGC